MPSFSVNSRELRKSFRNSCMASRNLEHADDECLLPTSLMLKFYAVECGLKAILLEERRGTDLEMSHDLYEIVKELRIDTRKWPSMFRIRSERDWHSSKYSHLAWRYGVRVASECSAKLHSGLNELISHIESRF